MRSLRTTSLYFLPLWSSFIICAILTILLWCNLFDITRSSLNDTIETSTLLLRFVNLLLTVEVSLLISTLYGIFVWQTIQHKQKNEFLDRKKGVVIAPENFYDGGKSIFPTFKALTSSNHASIRVLSFLTIVFMLLAYLLDIFYVGSLSYHDIEQCEVRDTEIDMMDSSLSSLLTVEPNSLMYSFGSRVSQLPYNNMPYSNTYIVPAINDINGLRNYTTIQYHVDVQCQDAIIRIVNSTNPNLDDQYQALASNGSYLWLMNVIRQYQMVIDPGYSNEDYAEIFVSVGGFQETDPIGLTSVMYGLYNVSTARCQTRVTYELINNVYNWGHDSSYTSARDMAKLAQRASLDTFEAFFVTSTHTIHNSISEWLADSVYNLTESDNSLYSRVNISIYEERLTMIAIEYLKGGGINGSMITPGLYCFDTSVKATIAIWYKVIFTVVQVVALAVAVFATLRSIKTDAIHNDTPTLLRFIQNKDNK